MRTGAVEQAFQERTLDVEGEGNRNGTIQERDGDLEKLLKLGSSQSSERWGAQFTFWHHQENTRGRFLYT